MEGAIDAWHNLSWFDGIMFSIWLGILYYGKLRIDLHFERKRSKRP